MSETPVSRPIDQAAAIDQANILMQALPHMLHYDDTIIVVKYGGHAMGDESVARNFARDMVLLEQSGVNPVVVHGGGPQIGAMLTKLGIKSEFADGLRVTDKATVEVVEMVLAGAINKQIVGFINSEGGRAIGLCGKDGNMVTAQKVRKVEQDGKPAIDLGFVGEPSKVDFDRAGAGARPRTDPRPRPHRAGRGGRDLQRQRRHLRRRHRRGAERQAPAAADRRAGRARQGQEPDQAIAYRRHPGADRRRHHHRRHDPQGRDLHLRHRTRRRRRGHPRRQDSRTPC